MKILETFKKFGKWFWGVVVALAFLSSFLAYYQFFYENRPSISAQIISEVNILDIHKPLKDLQILFQGDNIQEKNLNLRIYTVKIENTGKVNILQNYFDQNDNWGIRVENARIIETRLVGSNSDYINKNLSPQIQEDGVVNFNKIIFDQKDFFTVELLVLHDRNTPPHLYRVGKVAGIQENNFEILVIEHKEFFLASLFYGDWRVQVVRTIFYFIVSVIILFVSAFIIIKLQDRKEKKTRLAQSPRIDKPTSTSNYSSTSRSLNKNN